MIGLHTRGYRPAPGERIEHPGWTRTWFRAEWAAAKNEGFDEDTMGNLERLALACLDDRLAPDPLFWAQAARIIRVTGLGTGNGDRMAPGLLLARRGERRAGIPSDGRG